MHVAAAVFKCVTVSLHLSMHRISNAVTMTVNGVSSQKLGPMKKSGLDITNLWIGERRETADAGFCLGTRFWGKMVTEGSAP